jgi:hypothetical protein
MLWEACRFTPQINLFVLLYLANLLGQATRTGQIQGPCQAFNLLDVSRAFAFDTQESLQPFHKTVREAVRKELLGMTHPRLALGLTA